MNKVAIVTGGARGIGKAIILQLASEGINIVLNDIPQSKDIEQTLNEIMALGVEVIFSPGDVRNFDDAKKTITDAVDKFGQIDILVNNAGITRDGFIIKISEQDWDDVLDINLKGAFNFIKAVSRQMMKQRFGKIVNIASVIGLMGNSSQSNYSASKAGLIGLTKAAAKELSSRNINCNAVAPGFIASDMTDKLPEEVKKEYFKSIPLKRFGTPEEVAGVVSFLVSEQSKYITGQVLCIDGGLYM